MSSRTFARNAFALLAARGVTKALSVAVSLALVGYLGATRLGQYTTVMAATVIGEGIVAFGLPVWLQRACARSPSEAPRLVWHSLAVVTSTGIAYTGILLLQARLLGADRLTLIAFGGAGLGLSLWAIAATYNAATQAAERMHLVALVDIVSTVVRVGLMGAVLVLHLGVLELVGAYAVGHLTAAILASAVSPARAGLRALPATPRGLDRALMKEIVSGAWPFALTSLAVGLYFRADVYVLQQWHGFEGVGRFDSAYRAASEAIAAGGILAAVFFPQFSARWTADRADFHRLLGEATRLCSFAGCGMALFLALGAAPLAALYAPRIPGTAEWLRALSPAVALSGSGAAAIGAVMAAGRERLWLVGVSAVALAKLAANLLLVPQHGPAAAAWVASSGEALTLGLVVALSWRCLGGLAWCRGIASTFAASALGLGVGILFPQDPVIATALGLATYGVALVVGGFFTSGDVARLQEAWRGAPAGRAD